MYKTYNNFKPNLSEQKYYDIKSKHNTCVIEELNRFFNQLI